MLNDNQNKNELVNIIQSFSIIINHKFIIIMTILTTLILSISLIKEQKPLNLRYNITSKSNFIHDNLSLYNKNYTNLIFKDNKISFLSSKKFVDVINDLELNIIDFSLVDDLEYSVQPNSVDWNMTMQNDYISDNLYSNLSPSLTKVQADRKLVTFQTEKSILDTIMDLKIKKNSFFMHNLGFVIYVDNLVHSNEKSIAELIANIDKLLIDNKSDFYLEKDYVSLSGVDLIDRKLLVNKLLDNFLNYPQRKITGPNLVHETSYLLSHIKEYLNLIREETYYINTLTCMNLRSEILKIKCISVDKSLKKKIRLNNLIFDNNTNTLWYAHQKKLIMELNDKFTKFISYFKTKHKQNYIPIKTGELIKLINEFEFKNNDKFYFYTKLYKFSIRQSPQKRNSMYYSKDKFISIEKLKVIYYIPKTYKVIILTILSSFLISVFILSRHMYIYYRLDNEN